MHMYGVCIDVDECSEDVDNCDQVCINVAGSYRCSCRQGFQLVNNTHCQGRGAFNGEPQGARPQPED